jgi:hypothetical protein
MTLMIHSVSATIPAVAAKPSTGQELSVEEAKELQALKQRDREVRAHEQAHAAAGGQHVRGGPAYSYQRGTDGRQYAIGGEVQIDTSPIAGDPAATLQKMQQVQSAAMAPSEPSTQDRRVASRAAAAAAKARSEMQSGAGDDEADSKAARAYGTAQSNQTEPGEFLNIRA